MPQIVGDDYDRLAWDAWLAGEVGAEDSIAARCELVRMAERVRDLCRESGLAVPDWVPQTTEADYRTAVRRVRLGVWTHKGELLRAFARRYGFELARDAEVFFFRDEDMRPVLVWGEEAEALGINESTRRLT